MILNTLLSSQTLKLKVYEHQPNAFLTLLSADD